MSDHNPDVMVILPGAVYDAWLEFLTHCIHDLRDALQAGEDSMKRAALMNLEMQRTILKSSVRNLTPRHEPPTEIPHVPLDLEGK